jgi:hypothetical protein
VAHFYSGKAAQFYSVANRRAFARFPVFSRGTGIFTTETGSWQTGSSATESLSLSNPFENSRNSPRVRRHLPIRRHRRNRLSSSSWPTSPQYLCWRLRAGPFRFLERADSRIHVVSWYAAIAFLNELRYSIRSFLLSPKQRKLDAFGQSFRGKLRRLTTLDDRLDHPGSQKRYLQ